MSDVRLLSIYDKQRSNGDGETIGETKDRDPNGGSNPSDETVEHALMWEGWDLVRDISDRPDVTTVLAGEGEALWIVSDVYGPWAIQLTNPVGEDLFDGRFAGE